MVYKLTIRKLTHIQQNKKQARKHTAACPIFLVRSVNIVYNNYSVKDYGTAGKDFGTPCIKQYTIHILVSHNACPISCYSLHDQSGRNMGHPVHKDDNIHNKKLAKLNP